MVGVCQIARGGAIGILLVASRLGDLCGDRPPVMRSHASCAVSPTPQAEFENAESRSLSPVCTLLP